MKYKNVEGTLGHESESHIRKLINLTDYGGIGLHDGLINLVGVVTKTEHKFISQLFTEISRRGVDV